MKYVPCTSSVFDELERERERERERTTITTIKDRPKILFFLKLVSIEE